MSAVVCGKRSSSIFADELLPPSPPSPHSSHHHHPAKRSRCSPHRAFDAHRREALLHQLLSFLSRSPQLLERALEASGDDLDSAIKSLNELRLESAEAILSATGCKSENGIPTAVQPSVEGIVTNGGVDIDTKHPPAADSHQISNSGPEWVELFVREMTNASDMDDARARASRALEVLEKSIVEHAGAEAAQSLHKVKD